MLKEIENDVLEVTTKEHFFDASSDADPYFILMPVPNITGDLHIGHGINLTLQDLMCRQKKLEDKNVFFPPGADHAGIMGQYTAERKLEEKGISRHDLGKEKFSSFMKAEAQRHQSNLEQEMKTLGLKANWSHSWFTHDEKRDEYVRNTFIKLFERDLVYKEEGVVNWCPHCESCIADMELSLEETQEKLHKLTLNLPDIFEVELVFVQPELLLGAIGIGITKSNPYFEQLLNSSITVPIINKSLKVYKVEQRNDESFDDKLRLIVPGYNHDDFSFAQNNKLKTHNIYTDQGKVDYRGTLYSIDEVRTKILSDLEALPNFSFTTFGQGRARHSLCKTHVHPMIKPQWYMRMHKMEPKARELFEKNNMKFSGEFWQQGHEKVLENIHRASTPEQEKWWEGACVGVAQGYSSNKDWVISRQNWWGQDIPILQCKDCGHVMVDSPDGQHKCDVCNSSKLEQDPDVLDVWFSCAIWPDSVNPFGLKGNFSDLAVMGHDIFYFWVASANMIFMELYDQPAFKNVFVHGLLCDSEGKKMSKSLGNVISMKNIIDEYGTETLRAFVYSLMESNSNSEWLCAGQAEIAAAHETVLNAQRQLASFADRTDDAEQENSSLSQFIAEQAQEIAALLDEMRPGEAHKRVIDLLSSARLTEQHFSREQFLALLKVVHPFHPLMSNHLYISCLGGENCISEGASLKALIPEHI